MNPDTEPDVYGEATAEFYDLLSTAYWEHLGPQVATLMADVQPDLGPILDIGAGTGIGTAVVHAAVPAARIIAVEPSRAMRSILHTRLALDASLREHVTVMPFDLAATPLDGTLSGVLAMAVLGHLDSAGQDELWRVLAERLAPGAPAIVGVLPPDRPEQVPLMRFRALPVGEHVYEGWQQAEPVDDRWLRWTITYRVLAGERVIDERTATSDWFTTSAPDVAAATAALGFEMQQPDPDFVVLRRR